jgi:hypothetical protein
MPANINSLAPISLKVLGDVDPTVIPVENHAFSADIISNPHFHSGNTSPTQVTVPGANPKITFSTPFKTAYDMFGLGIVRLEELDVYLSKYIDFVRSPNSDHTRITLSDGAFAAAQIVSWSVNVDGILMADVTIDLLSDDQEHPFVFEQNVALPTLPGNPALHTLGPAQINNVIIPGCSSDSGDMGGSTIVQRNDGDLYPRVAARPQIAPTAKIAHEDPVAVLAALGLLGTNITAVTELFFKAYDVVTGVVSQFGGIKIAIGKGRIHPDGWTAAQGGVANTGLTVIGIVDDGVANPFTVTLGVTVPNTP